MYHISDLKKFVRCPRYYYLSRGNSENFIAYLRNDDSPIDLLGQKLGADRFFSGNVGDPGSLFFENVDEYLWFKRPRFEDHDLRINVPLMHKNEDGSFDLYFLYYGTNIKELDLFSYQISLELLHNAGLEINDIKVAYINGDYVFKDKIDVNSLFIIVDKYKGKRIFDLVCEEIIDYKAIIKQIEGTDIDEYKPIKTHFCHQRNICQFYNECFKEELQEPNDSILTLVSSRYKTTMKKEGISFLKDVDIERLEGNRVQYAQIMASKNNGLFVDKFSLKHWLRFLDKRPITFIDFEWDRYLIPKYEKMKPLDVLPFEFCLYVLDENDELNSKSFVSNGDCRREFAEMLLKSIPEEGPIVAYNAIGAECLRIKELATLFPDLSDKLLALNKRFVDLAYPFTEGLVYHVDFKGVFSLKKLVSIVSNYNYGTLDINDGMKAVGSWRCYDRGTDIVDEEKLLDDLIEYCSLDAYGLYLVFKWLQGLL